MSERPHRDLYEKLFLDFCRRVEKWMIRLIAGAFVALLLAQLLLQFAWARSWMNRVDKLEGVPYRHAGQTVLPADSANLVDSQRN